MSPVGITLKNPPDVYVLRRIESFDHCDLFSLKYGSVTCYSYRNLREFVGAHSAKLKLPLGKEPDTQLQQPQPQREVLKPDLTTTALQALAGTAPSSPSSLKGSNSGPEDDHMGPNDATQLCVICMDKPVGAVFLECGHLACCVTCAAPLRLCPICRGTISRTVQIFRP